MHAGTDEFRRIPQFPDYGVTRDGRVKNIRLNHELKIVYVHGITAAVKLRKDGITYHRTVNVLINSSFEGEL